MPWVALGALGALATAATSNSSVPGASAVLTSLLEAYGSTSIRPGLSPQANGAVDQVEVQFYIDRFHGINQIGQTWGATGYLRSWWRDPRLAFDPALAGGAQQLSLSPKETTQIWNPSLYWEKLIDASAASSPTDAYKESLWIYPDGRVFRSQQRAFTLACPLNLERMPFDMQTCHWTLGLYSSMTNEVHLSWRNNTVAMQAWDQPACRSQWVPIALRQRSVVQVYDSGGYSYALVEIDFVRGFPWRMFRQYFITSIALCFLSYIGSWINPAATPARVALGIITILTVVNSFISISSELPPSTDSTWMSEFMYVSFLFNVACFFQQVAVNFGMMAHTWLLEFDTDYTDSIAQRKKDRVDGVHGRISPTRVLVSMDGGGISVEEPIAEPNDDLAPVVVPASATSLIASPQVAPSGLAKRGSAGGAQPILARFGKQKAKVEKERTPTKRDAIKAAIDINGDGNISCAEVLKFVSRVRLALKVPVLRFAAWFRFLDHYWRFVFPCAYIPFLVYTLADVNYGNDWAALIANSPAWSTCT